MYHFFVEPGQIQGKQIFIEGKDVNHIKNVLRMRIGEELAVGNGMDEKEYRCRIEAFEEEEYWTIDVKLTDEKGKKPFLAKFP